MTYYEFQQRVFENKIRRNFNVTDVGKEIILMTEEFGELCKAHIGNDREEIIDAIGDLMIYCLGLCSMMKCNADDILNLGAENPQQVSSLKDYIPYVGKEIGLMAKIYKKSDKKIASEIDKKSDIIDCVGNLMFYLASMFEFIRVDKFAALEQIIKNNELRKHYGSI